MKFLRNVLATLVGLFVFFMIFFFGILLIGALFGNDSNSVSVKENSVLELDLSKVSNDYGGKFIYKDYNYSNQNHDGFVNVLAAIDEASKDDKIQGISILNNTSGLGMAQTRELREKLKEFKSSGKFIVAYSNSYTQKEYYLESVADTVYLNPVGDFDFKGLSAEILFYKNLQDKTGVKMEVIRHGKYKSAVEPYLENNISEANREQTHELLQSIWNTMVSDIALSRKLSVDSLNSYAENLSVRTPDLALKMKMVDKVAYEDEYHNAIKKFLNVKLEEEYNTVDILDYAYDVATTVKNYDAKDKIAVIYAQGTITSGEGDVSYIGEGSIRRALFEARNDKNVKSIVLRVDSPGGSALTSDLIWREVELTKMVKPVVVSMGNLAASGGYYISCNANRIFADPNTITGSIGVFGTLPNITTLSQNMGINAEQVVTHKNALGYSIFEPLDENYKKIVQEGVENIYDTFVKRVAAGRKMSYEAVNEIAQGRVWTGSDALKNGLIDEIGNLDAAIAEAAKLGKTTSYRLIDYPEYEKSVKDLFGGMFGMSIFQSKEDLLKEYLGAEAYQMIQQIKVINQQKGMQAVMPYQIDIK